MVVILIILGGLLRIYKLQELAGFDYDGEKAAFWVWNFIVNHKFSLIGQETSVGGVFVGPFYYYFLAPFYWFFKMDPVAASVMAVLVSVLTTIMIYKLGKILYSRTAGLVALFIYVFSFQINFYDRTTAPSNLVMLLSVTTLYALVSNKIYLLGFVLGLSFSTHPTAILLIPLVFIYWWFTRNKITLKQIMVIVVPMVLLFLPLLWFDFRHDWLNTRGIWKLATGNTFSEQAYPFLFKFIINLKTLVLVFGSIILPRWPLLGWFLFPLALRVVKQKLLLIWIFFPLVILSFYRGTVPEYYFLLTFPLLIIFFAQLLVKTKKIFSGVLLIAFAAVNIYSLSTYQNIFGLAFKKSAVDYILANSNNKSFTVNFDGDFGQQNGFNYLFVWREKIPLKNGEKHYIIVLPFERRIENGPVFGAIKVLNNE